MWNMPKALNTTRNITSRNMLPFRVHIQDYRIFTTDGETFIELTDVTTSREWINALLVDYPQPEKRRFKVPAAVKMLL